MKALKLFSVLALVLMFAVAGTAQIANASEHYRAHHGQKCEKKNCDGKMGKKCPMMNGGQRFKAMDRTAGSVPVYKGHCPMMKPLAQSPMERSAGGTPIYSKGMMMDMPCCKDKKSGKCPMKMKKHHGKKHHKMAVAAEPAK